MLKNVAGQKVGAQLVSATDGSAFTGAVTVAVTVDAGTQATGSVGSGACTHEGGGYHTYAPAQAETNGDLVAFTFSGTGAVPVTVQVYPLPTTGVLAPTTAGRTLTVDASGNGNANLVNIAGSAVSTSTAQLGVNVVNAAGTAWGSGAITSGVFAAGAINAAAIAADAGTEIGAAVLSALGTGTWATAIPWNASWDAEVQSEVQDAIEANNLDHLVKIAVDTDFATTVHSNSVIGHLADNGSGFDRTTDSLETIRDAMATAANLSLVAINVNSVLTDTNELQTDWADGGRLDLILDARASQASVDTIDDLLDTEVAAIKSDTAAILLDTGTDGVVIASSHNLYHAEINLTVDEANTQDEWTIQWFKNGVPQTSGITSPTLQVVKRADGTDLVASHTPTQIGSTGVYKSDQDTNRITAGEAVLVVVTATIDAGSRTWRKFIGRDSAA